MRSFRLALLSGYYALVCTVPMLALGQSALPKQIVPCSGAIARNGIPACTCDHIVALAQNLMNTGIFFFVIFAAVMFAYGGFLYLTNEAIGKQQQAKGIFKNVAIGLVVILSAWLVVDVIMKSLLGGSFGPWNAVAPLQEVCRSLGIT